MCFFLTSIQECIKKEVLDILILEFKRIEVETTLQLVNEFFQAPIELLLDLPKSAYKNLENQFQILIF